MQRIQGAERVAQEMWPILRDEAHAMVTKEPFLAPVLLETVLSANSLVDALARKLASALAGPGIDESAYRALLQESMEHHRGISWAAAQDLSAVHSRDPVCRTHLHAFLNYKSFHAVQIHRVAHELWEIGRHEIGAWLSNRVSVALGPDIHPGAQLGVGIILDHGSGIVIGETAVVEDNVTLMQNVTLGGTGKVFGDRHPKVRRGALIGAGANIIGNVDIGAFSKVGAGSVVLKDVPPCSTVAGVPARTVRLCAELENGRAATG